MIETNGTLLVGTGREGTVYQIDPAAEETVSIAKVDPKDVLCLLRAHDGQVWMGQANGGQIGALESGFASLPARSSARRSMPSKSADLVKFISAVRCLAIAV